MTLSIPEAREVVRGLRKLPANSIAGLRDASWLKLHRIADIIEALYESAPAALVEFAEAIYSRMQSHIRPLS